MSKRVLVLYAHPSTHRSEVNAPLFKATSEVDQVTLVDLYAEYPTYDINIQQEQQRLKDHDVIVFMFPLYWYSTPSILKEWQDLVLEYGFAYGKCGTALNGKTFFCAISAGGSEDAYQTDGFNHFTINELLQPLEQTSRLTGMEYWPPFALFSARTAAEEGRIPQHVENWKALLQAIVNEEVSASDLTDVSNLSNFVAEKEG